VEVVLLTVQVEEALQIPAVVAALSMEEGSEMAVVSGTTDERLH
jgi:hypothetical protein